MVNKQHEVLDLYTHMGMPQNEVPFLIQKLPLNLGYFFNKKGTSFWDIPICKGDSGQQGLDI